MLPPDKPKSSTSTAPTKHGEAQGTSTAQMSHDVAECLTNHFAKSATCDTPSCEDLPERQQSAIELLLNGGTDVSVAAALGVNRRTIQRWRTDNPHFRDELTRRRCELFGNTMDRYRTLLSAAMDVLDKHVHDRYAPTALRAARALLSMSRVGSMVAKTSMAQPQSNRGADAE